MPFTIEGLDTEFAASTGTNVDTSPNSSRFDNPPQGSQDLRITTNAGDNDPRLFELGDTYDITWGGQGGGGSIEDAVVIRSDPSPDGGTTGIVVFSGVDENGDPAQIIWTPGFDLEGWYADNYNLSLEPEFYTEDMDSSYDHKYVCFAAETRVLTPTGLRPVCTLRQGDLVTTKDVGDVAVLWIGRRICAAQGANAPVVFDPFAMGNMARLRLSQQHRVLMRSPIVQYYFGMDEAFVPAKACVNGRDIRIIPEARICYVHILLEKHGVLWAEGLECESLFLGDEAVKALYGVTEVQGLHQSHRSSGQCLRTARPVLKMYEARLAILREQALYGADLETSEVIGPESGLPQGGHKASSAQR